MFVEVQVLPGHMVLLDWSGIEGPCTETFLWALPCTVVADLIAVSPYVPEGVLWITNEAREFDLKQVLSIEVWGC